MVTHLTCGRRWLFTRYQVGDQPLPAGRVLPCTHDSLSYTGMLPQNSLNLAEFNAEATEFHLLVHSTNEFNFTAGVKARQVACLVQTRAWFSAERVGDESLCRQPRMVQITARETGAAHVNLAGNADWHRPEVLVQQIDLHVGDGPTEGRNTIFACLELDCRRVNSRFRRRVGVE